MVDDMKALCKMCEKCQRPNTYIYVILCIHMYVLYICSFTVYRKFDKTSVELHPLPVKGKVWHTIGVDLIVPIPDTINNKYVMTVCCLFSKWPEVTALPDKTAIGVAEFLFHCFTSHRCCMFKITG